MASKSRGKGAGVQLNLFGKVSTRAHHVIYPNAKSVYEKFINAYCGLEGNVKTKQQLMYDDKGRGYMEAEGTRKRATAKVKVIDKGTGLITVNGQSLLRCFPTILDREQVIFPLHFVGKMGELDVECEVSGGGSSGQAGAIRFALSRALQSFVDRHMVEKLRLAGLLTHDPRHLERQKPGQSGARRKFTWKKR